jgi:hypothetical protein
MFYRLSHETTQELSYIHHIDTAVKEQFGIGLRSWHIYKKIISTEIHN